jgi:hypothetical protein
MIAEICKMWLQRNLQNQNFEYTSCQFKTKNNAKTMNVVITKMQHPQLHPEWQWQAAMTPHWLCQLPMVGAYKYTILCIPAECATYWSMQKRPNHVTYRGYNKTNLSSWETMPGKEIQPLVEHWHLTSW